MAGDESPSEAKRAEENDVIGRVPEAHRSRKHSKRSRQRELIETSLERRRRLNALYRRWSAYPMYLFSIAFLVGLVLALDVGDREAVHAGTQIMTVCWMAFIADYVIGLSLADNIPRYVRTHVFQLIAIVFPPLRIGLVLVAFLRLFKGGKQSLAQNLPIFALYLTTITVVAGAVSVVYFERQNPDANITSLGIGLWWVMETITTVGYGDYYPITLGGRIVAVMLFLGGIGLLSAATATLAQRVLAGDQRRKMIAQGQELLEDVRKTEEGQEQAEAHQVALKSEVAQLREQVRALTESIGELARSGAVAPNADVENHSAPRREGPEGEAGP